MQAYEFSTKVGPGGKLVIPESYTKDLPVGDSVRVIILVNEFSVSLADEPKNLSLLEQIVTEIRATPQNPANVQSASAMLTKHLANAPHEFDPSFNVAAWNEEWDRLEEEMKTLEMAEELAEANVQGR